MLIDRSETEHEMEYTVENYIVDIDADDYMARFRDERRFLELCRQCPNFGCSWACPPLAPDVALVSGRYRYVRIIATKITPARTDMSVDRAMELIRPERIRLERYLLNMESRCDARAFSFGGKCLYCGDEPCARSSDRPCRHPDKVRPSLEAFGFDLGLTLRELFGIELLWGNDGMLPRYIVLVSALFHNSLPDEFVD